MNNVESKCRKKHYFDLYFVVSRIYAVVPSKPLAVLANPNCLEIPAVLFSNPPLPPTSGGFLSLSPPS
jgi:hypothetical protein